MNNIYDNFIFLPVVDQKECDFPHSENNFNDILEKVLTMNNIVAVNSRGYMKTSINNLEPSQFFNENDGIFIKKEHCQQILDDLDNSNKFLQIQNKEEIDLFIDKIKFKGPEGDTVIFTNANSWYIETLVLNLLHSYNQFNKKLDRKIGVFCSDEEAYNKSVKLNFDCCMIKCNDMKINNSLDNITREEYRRLSFTKTLIIQYLISKNYTVLYIDPDMSFNFKKYPDIDLLDKMLNRQESINYAFDKHNNLSGIINYNINIDNIMCGVINYSNDQTSIYLNSNLMLVSPTFFNKILFKININTFESICDYNENGSDETYINRVGRLSNYFSFWSQIYYPDGNSCLRYKDYAYMFHANCVSGLENKINLLKNCGGWYLDFVPIITTLKKWQTMIKNESELIIQASHPNGETTDKTIGMSYQYLNKNIDYKQCQLGNHENLVLCAIKNDTDFKRRGNTNSNRKNILKTLEQNNIHNINLLPSEYFKQLPTYKFVISPEGNNVDCHRHYEVLLAGCIPIVEDNEIIRNKYGDCPILYTKDYSEITPEYLEKKYKEMKSRLYNFSKLYISYFSQHEQFLMKDYANYWCHHLLGKTIY
jgi:hypothetical protein